MQLNVFVKTIRIFPGLLEHQEGLPKHSHHSSSQSIQFPENRHICLKTGQVILEAELSQIQNVYKTRSDAEKKKECKLTLFSTEAPPFIVYSECYRY